MKKQINVNKYNNVKIFSKLDMNKSADKAYATKVISAFENFIQYLQDDDAIIDHTYLWDIVSMPNNYLFSEGVNLVIFNLPDDDITNNVELVCPTNHYSNEFYQARKPTIILMKKGPYYEPIYSYTKNKKGFPLIVKEYKELNPHLSKTMKTVFKEIIKPFFNKVCRPLDSMPNVYKMKKPLLLHDLIKKLDQYKYTINKFVLNFNNKVIGVMAEEPPPYERNGFIPCYPSAINEEFKKDVNVVFMTDLSLWTTYKNTVQFLNKLNKRSKLRKLEADIPYLPAFKIVEEDHVVGILTNTNQFIQLSQPIRVDEVESELNLPSIDETNYIINSTKPKEDNYMIQSEVAITTNQDVDEERVNYIKKIKLETSFYNVFRNTIRVLINNYEYSKIRVKIENELLKEYLIYSEKLKNVDRLLRELVKDKIQFIGDQNYYKLINEVSTCVVKNKDKCASSPNLCVVTEKGSCNLILPEKNLITNKINEPIYYGRMADELIRYNRIQSFMLQPQTYLSFNNIGYNLRDNELILIHSLLTKEYFETLKPTVTNKYIKQMSYDEVNPIISQMYENKFPLVDNSIIGKNNKDDKNDKKDKNNKDDKVVKCIKIKPRIQSTAWNSCFPDNYGEIVYGNTNYCTINFIIDLIERKTGEKLTVNGVKNVLFDEYKKYLDKYIEKIVDILILEGKKTLGDQVSGGIISFSNLIYTDNYFFTTFDLWLLVTKYEIPTVFISPHFILQTKYSKRAFIAYGERNDQFAFIIIPGFTAEKVPTFKLIVSSEKEAFISIDKLNGECLDNIQEALNNKETIESYLEKFTKPNTRKKKPLPFIIEDDSEEVPEKAVEENVVGEKAVEENVVGEKAVEEKATSGKTKKNKKNNVPAKPRTKKNKI
jgi:hypothetical protein